MALKIISLAIVKAVMRSKIVFLFALLICLSGANVGFAQSSLNESGDQAYSETDPSSDYLNDDSHSVDSLEEEASYQDFDSDDYAYDEEDYQAKQNFTLESGESLPRSEISKRYYSEIEKILAGPDFAQKEKVTRRRVKDVTDEETREEKFPQWVIDLVKALEGMEGGRATFSSLLEILVWTVIIGAILIVLIKYRSRLSDWASGLGAREIEPELPTSLFGLDIQKESAPKDVVNTAKAHWDKFEKRNAIATLLRAGLIKLLHEYGCRFFSSDTEAECCDRIDQQVTKSMSVYMRRLVGVWQHVAYAHLDPSEHEFEQLCIQWREVFE